MERKWDEDAVWFLFGLIALVISAYLNNILSIIISIFIINIAIANMVFFSNEDSDEDEDGDDYE
mgnify:CR=1 FL=1